MSPPPDSVSTKGSPSDGFETAGFVVMDLGILDYEAVYELQKGLLEKKRSSSVPDTLIFVEHPDVYTYGRKSKEVNDSLKHFSIERGGEATFHNPGQLVCYPVLQLRQWERDLHLHLRRLEETLIDVLDEFRIPSEKRPGETGVWVVGQNKKIASVGVAVANWVTYHGCALNVENDLSGFAKIHPCGYPSSVMTSMKHQLLDACPSIAEVKESFLAHFSREFQRQLIL